jgi:hypothetical protein
MCQTKEQPLFTYDLNSLRRGDIILSTTDEKPSRLIRLATKSDFSHAMLFTGKIVVHADGDGVFTANLQRRFFREGASIVLRLRNANESEINTICKFATGQIGALYSVPEAILSRLLWRTVWRSISPSQYCSRLVAQAYKSGGKLIVGNSDFCTPGDIEKCSILDVVEGAVREALPEEIEIRNVPDTLKIHQERTFMWLRKVRKLAKKKRMRVSTMNEAFQFVEKYPDLDQVVVQCINESRYLEGFALDKMANPHRYDIPTFRKLLSRTPALTSERLNSEVDTNKNIMEETLMEIKRFSRMNSHTAVTMIDMHRQRFVFYQDRLRLLIDVCKEEKEYFALQRAEALLERTKACI